MVCFCVMRVFVYVFGLNVFVWFNCDVWRDVVWPVLRVFLLFDSLYVLFLWRVAFACSCV